MKKSKQVLCMILMLITLSACSYVGEPDFNMFMRQFNDANENIQITDSKTIKDNQETSNKYSCFINIDKKQDYLITVYEDKKSSYVTSCSLSILKSGETNIDNVNNLFCSMLYGYNLTPEEKSKEIFNKLKLNNKATYLTSGKIEKEFENLKVTIIINGAGMSITIK